MPLRQVKKILAALAVIPLLAAGSWLVLGMLSGNSAGGTLRSGRSVMAHSDAITLNSQFTADTATIETAGKVIVVKPTSLMVDGHTVAEIDGQVADVQVHVKNSVVTFVADGKPVTTSR